MKRIYVEGFSTLLDVLESNNVPAETRSLLVNLYGYDYSIFREHCFLPGIEIQLIDRYITSDTVIIGYYCLLDPQKYLREEE